MEPLNKLGGRKFVLTSAVTFLLFVALFTGKLDGAAFVAALTLSVGIYTGGNVGSKMAYKDTRVE